ncbi:unnamed protein product [Victoria cruziana]
MNNSMHGGGRVRGCSRSSCSICPFDSSIHGCSRMIPNIRGCRRASVDLQHVRRVLASSNVLQRPSSILLHYPAPPVLPGSSLLRELLQHLHHHRAVAYR